MSLSRRRLALAAIITVGSTSIPTSNAAADVSTWNWSGSDSLSAGNRSNVAGFWQAIVCGNSSDIYLDGIYGSQTQAATIKFKREVLGWVNDNNPNVIPSIWNQVRTSTFLGFPHLYPTGGGHYAYYAGGASSVDLYWDSTYGWKFYQQPSNNWYYATTARTMGSTLCF